MNYVIIGNSASGIAAVEAIRESDCEGKITVISDEQWFNYSRPLISYFLGKKVSPGSMSFREPNFYKDNKVDLILNNKATKLYFPSQANSNQVKKKKCVFLADGQKIPFDKLLIATGGVPVIPKIKGSSLNGVFTYP